MVREAGAYAESIIKTIHEPLLTLTPDLTVKSVNPAFYSYFKADPAGTLGHRIYDLGNGQWNIPQLRHLLEEILPENSVIENFEVSHQFETIGYRVMLLNARKLDHLGLILLGVRDITARKRFEDSLTDQVQQSTKALSSTQAELRALSGRLMAVQEEERARIARELHDDLAQRTAVMDLALERVAPLMQASPGGYEALSSVREHLAKLSADLRDISHRLHPTVIADLGLPAALKQLVFEFNAGGGEAHFEERSDKSSPLKVKEATALFRIAQEALRNAGKHARGAPVRIVFAVTDHHVRLVIEDTGPGFHLDDVPHGRSLGLLSMQERANLVGASLSLRTKPGRGTQISVRLPGTIHP
jgi:signal transduction histidine kinase